MAAIIAQMAANNRERRRRIREKDFILPPSKSAYYLPPFEPCFDPKKHNQYLKMKEMRERRTEILEKAKARALELKQQEDYKLVQMLWTMKREMAHEKFSMDWAPSSTENVCLESKAADNSCSRRRQQQQQQLQHQLQQAASHQTISFEMEETEMELGQPEVPPKQQQQPKQAQMQPDGCLMTESTRLIYDVINSLLGIFGLSIFIIIFIVLFLIFGNIDGKPWTTVFEN